MRILGISDHITSGAALLEDGRVVAAVNEERLARKKMVMGFPRKSIAEVMRLAGVGPEDIDHVAVASITGNFLNDYVDASNGVFALDEGMIKELFFTVGGHAGSLRNRIPLLDRIYYGLKQPLFWKRKRSVPRVLRDEFDIHRPVEFIEHHFAHAAAAYYASGYDEAMVVTLDGAGDGHCSHVYAVRAGEWRHLHSIPAFDSLGCYYAYVTEIAGFKAGKHEGKITGLAAYGTPSYRDVFDRFIEYRDGTMFNISGAYRQSAFSRIRAALPPDYSREDLAATIQDLTEDLAGRYIAHWARQTGLRNVAVAGGVFANVKVNQRVHEMDGVDSVFVYPAMSDEGISAGAALVLRDRLQPDQAARVDRCFDHVYLGPEFSERQIVEALDAVGVEYARSEDIEAEIARLLRDGTVVARFNGRMEYGPRALGNRSILYRPDDPAVNDWLNERLQRTEFMPFAPATLAEDAEQCYVGLDGARDTARYMTITFDCTDRMKRSCPGVVHVDGTARPQLVSQSDNPTYYRIIREFQRLTGLSSIVNTSFNIHEEPIVCTPQDAIRAFNIGHLDVLAIGPFLARNSQASQRRDAASVAAAR